ncbi:hypothetical protein Tco_0598876 [Tanacetum coccineum]
MGRDEDGNPKYRPVAPSFLDIEDDMERALAMEADFNPFKNIIVFKKLIDFLGSLPVKQHFNGQCTRSDAVSLWKLVDTVYWNLMRRIEVAWWAPRIKYSKNFAQEFGYAVSDF